MKIQVAIIEDEKEISDGFRSLLTASEEFECVAVFDNAEDAIKKIPALKPDVVLTDIHLNGKSGIDCIIALKPVCPDVDFLICTSYEDSENVFHALESGASGYIVKTNKSNILLDAIADVYKGGAPMSSQIARKVVQSFHSRETAIELEKLSGREQEILKLLSKGLRYKEIGESLFISTDTVRTHIYNIYQKLQVNSKIEVLNKVYKK